MSGQPLGIASCRAGLERLGRLFNLVRELLLLPATRADSYLDWSTTGQQGAKNWLNGYYNLTGDGDGVYDPSVDFTPFLNDLSGTPETDPVEVNHWNGSAYDFEGNPPWTFLTALSSSDPRTKTA